MRLTEKQLQKLFVEKLRMSNWLVKEQVFDSSNKNRIDAVAYHTVFEVWFGFELKVPTSIKDYTKCLRQMIRYRKANFGKIHPKILCLITPKNVSYNWNCGFIIRRFFWRWGFGVGDYESMKVDFVNGESIVELNMANPYSNSYYTPQEQIREVIKRTQKYWDDVDAD